MNPLPAYSSAPYSFSGINVGSTFMTDHSPLRKLVAQLPKDEFHRMDYDRLLAAMHSPAMSDYYHPGLDQYHSVMPSPALQIFDVDTANILHDRGHIAFQELGDAPARARRVNDFLTTLRACESDVHTRILMFTTPDASLSKDLEAAQAAILLTAHVLAVELMLAHDVAKHLAFPSAARFDSQLFKVGRMDAEHASISLGRGVGENDGKDSFDAVWLGERHIGSGRPSLILIRTHIHKRRPETDDHFVDPKIADHSLLRQALNELSYDAKMYYFNGFVKLVQDRYKRTSSPTVHRVSACLALQYGNISRVPRIGDAGHWLVALLHFAIDHLQAEFHIYQSVFDGLARTSVPEPLAPAGWVLKLLSGIWHETKGLEIELRQLKAEVTDLRESIPSLCCDDFAPAEKLLARLEKTIEYALERQGNMVSHRQANADRKAQQQTSEMTEIQIAESRSAISLTFLAFVFVPISLATSIFGMNVQEINQSGHNIWTFVLTSIVIVLACALAWLAWRALRNFRVLMDGHRATIRTWPAALLKVIEDLWRDKDVLSTYTNLLGWSVRPEARKVHGAGTKRRYDWY